MARVVQRRSNPPYLLILFVFLFLISATLAIVFFNNASDLGKQVRDRETQRDFLAKPYELTNPRIASRMERAKAPGGVSVIGQFSTDLTSLVSLVAGSDIPVEQAIASSSELNPQAGLLGEIRSLTQRLAAADQRVSDLNAQVASMTATVQANTESLAAAEQKYNEQADLIKAQLTAKQNEFDALSSSYQQNLENARAEWNAKMAEKDSRISLLLQEAQKSNQEKRMLENKLALLELKLRDSRPPGPGEQMALKADGRIIRALPERGRVYINLGRNQRAVIGLTFAVYDAGVGVNASGEGKASIVITNVFDDTSEARIVRTSPADPLLEGDMIANVAFDATRSFVFVVDGDFDLDGDGRIDAAGNQRVREMITAFGGTVEDEVTVNTDFVVLGTEPIAPPRPSDIAPPAEMQIYRDRVATLQRYSQVKENAFSLQVPVLNTNRFLALVGYVPDKSNR